MSALYNSQETIAALATPAGVGGIAVIRISGEKAFSIVDTIFSGNGKISDAPSHTIHYGSIIDPSSHAIIDTVLVSLFRNPHSYTGEDVVEVSTHGGYFIAGKIVSVLHSIGARAAGPGEFTLRAFLNGKLDLTQAEAVADLIHSRSEKAHRASIEQLNGRLARYIGNLRTQLLDLCSLMELELDFSQEGIELTHTEESLRRIESIESKISAMIESYSSGKLAREGVRVALAGRPNAGKSSLLNILLEEERAIVSDIPGTTRDVIEESITLEGLEFIFTDTAGLRESIDIIEKEGIRRAIEHLQKSDIALFIIDSSVPLSKDDLSLFNEVISSLRSEVHVLFVINKIDNQNPAFDPSMLVGKSVVRISCTKNQGIDRLKKTLARIVLPGKDTLSESVVVTNNRHKNALVNALNSLHAAKGSMIDGLSGDFIAVDLRDALNYLGEIIGLTTSDDILNNIFSQFCIGK